MKHIIFILSILFSCLLLCLPAYAQIIYTIAGTGVPGPSGDGGPATAAQLGGL